MSPMTETAGLILAAGLSSRMGEFKPLLPLGKKTLIESSIDSMLAAGVPRVTVVLGYRGEEVAALLRKGYDAKALSLAWNRNYAATDMLHSIRLGLRVLPSCEAFFLLPGDMPAVSPGTYRLEYKAWKKTGARVVFPTLEGRRKHPPLISTACVSDILRFSRPGGLRELWKEYEEAIVTIPVEDSGCRLDADTREDYADLLRYLEQGKPPDNNQRHQTRRTV